MISGTLDTARTPTVGVRERATLSFDGVACSAIQTISRDGDEWKMIHFTSLSSLCWPT